MVEIFNSNFMLFKLSQEFGFRSAKCTPVNWTSLDINCHLSLPLCELVQLANSSQLVDTFSFHVGVYGRLSSKK